MADTRCPITDLLPTECAHCRKLPDLEAPSTGLRLLGKAFPAAYPGRCAGCHRDFTAGTRIRCDLENGGYLADCCWYLADRQ
jgi:hypothetical protein